MTKYIRTNELVNAASEMLEEISRVYFATVFMIDSGDIDDSDFYDIDRAMTRLTDAWEALKKTLKEEKSACKKN